MSLRPAMRQIIRWIWSEYSRQGHWPQADFFFRFLEAEQLDLQVEDLAHPGLVRAEPCGSASLTLIGVLSIDEGRAALRPLPEALRKVASDFMLNPTRSPQLPASYLNSLLPDRGQRRAALRLLGDQAIMRDGLGLQAVLVERRGVPFPESILTVDFQPWLELLRYEHAHGPDDLLAPPSLPGPTDLTHGGLPTSHVAVLHAVHQHLLAKREWPPCVELAVALHGQLGALHVRQYVNDMQSRFVRGPFGPNAMNAIRLTPAALPLVDSSRAERTLFVRVVNATCRVWRRKGGGASTCTLTDLATETGLPREQVLRAAPFLEDEPIWRAGVKAISRFPPEWHVELNEITERFEGTRDFEDYQQRVQRALDPVAAAVHPAGFTVGVATSAALDSAVAAAPMPDQPDLRMTDQGTHITDITRRNLFDELATGGIRWNGRLDELEFLRPLFPDLDDLPSKDPRFQTMVADVTKHCIEDPGDWDRDWVFSDERLDLLACADEKFLKFLSDMVHPRVRSDRREAAKLITIINRHLAPDGWQLGEVGQISGRPVYCGLPIPSKNQVSPGAASEPKAVQIQEAPGASRTRPGRPGGQPPMRSDPAIAIQEPTPVTNQAALGGGVKASSDVSLEGRAIGNYTFERLIGTGGMCDVYRAIHTAIGKRCAIKVMRSSSAHGLAERFLDEAKAVAALDHSGIVQIFDYGQLPDGRPFMVLEYLDGISLSTYLQKVGSPRATEGAAIIHGVCNALSAAHKRGIVHRDIKPDNVFLVTKDERQVVKVLDFGIARLRGDVPASAPETNAGQILGTPEYMSPEQAQGRVDEIGPASDIYSCGVLAYRVLVGQLPFPGAGVAFPELVVRIARDQPASPRSVRPDLPHALDEVLLRALAKRPEDRWATIGAFNVALAEALSERTASIGTASPPTALGRPHASAELQERPVGSRLAVRSVEWDYFNVVSQKGPWEVYCMIECAGASADSVAALLPRILVATVDGRFVAELRLAKDRRHLAANQVHYHGHEIEGKVDAAALAAVTVSGKALLRFAIPAEWSAALLRAGIQRPEPKEDWVEITVVPP